MEYNVVIYQFGTSRIFQLLIFRITTHSDFTTPFNFLIESHGKIFVWRCLGSFHFNVSENLCYRKLRQERTCHIKEQFEPAVNWRTHQMYVYS